MAKYIVRKNVNNEFYWVLRSEKNFEVVAISSEYYTSKQNVLHSIAWTQANATTQIIEDESA